MTRTKLVTLDEVLSVYSGRAGKCCCGCSGKHFVPSTTDREAYKKANGHALDPKSISDCDVAFVMRKLNAAIAAGDKIDDGGSYVACESGKRLYVVYLKEEEHSNQAEAAQGVW